jgi:parallel beta-helix repeat protein
MSNVYGNLANYLYDIIVILDTMRRRGNKKEDFPLFALWVLVFLVMASVCYAKPHNCGQERWSPEMDTNKKYFDNITYTKNASGFGVNICFEREIDRDGDFTFAWRTSSNDIYKHLSIMKNDVKFEPTFRTVGDWSESYPISSKNGDKFIWTFWSMSPGEHQIWISFPGPNVQSTGVFAPNRAPEKPEILMGPNEGHNLSLYSFSARSNDFEKGKLNYTFYWGDGNKTQIGPFDSGDTATANYSWTKAGTYDIKIMATDDHGNNSAMSKEKKVKISWLVKVPPGVLLQPIIDKIHSNTTVLLEGKNYDGPLNITKYNIILTSNNTSSEIRSCIIDSKNYTIGLINADHVALSNLNISDGLYGIYLQNSSYCELLNNNISFKKCGINIIGGCNNAIVGNCLEKDAWHNSTEDSVGISILNSEYNTIECNRILRLEENDSDYFIIHSPLGRNLTVNSVAHGHIIEDECWCHYAGGSWIRCMNRNNETNCTIGLNFSECP